MAAQQAGAAITAWRIQGAPAGTGMALAAGRAENCSSAGARFNILPVSTTAFCVALRRLSVFGILFDCHFGVMCL